MTVAHAPRFDRAARVTWIAETLMLAHGWRRFLILLVAGAVAGLAAPPFFILPALFATFPLWVWALDGAEQQRGWRRLFSPAFFIGFAFGLGYFAVVLHWIATAAAVDGGLMLLVIPVDLFLLSAVLAALWGLASALAHLLWSPGPWRIVTLATFIAAAEFVRGHLFSGFPFDLLGYTLTANPEMMQAASLIGVYGLTFVAPLIAMTPALVWPADQRGLTRRLLPLFLGLGVIALQLGYGYQRIASTVIAERTDIKLRLVQPMVLEHSDWSRADPATVVDRLIELTSTRLTPSDPGLDGVTHVIWPESSFPFFLNDYPDVFSRVARMLPDGVTLLTGAPRRGTATEDETPPLDYNALLAIDTNGEIIATYDKAHLVPFGEFLPFPEILEALGVRQLVPGPNGWSPGDGKRLVTTANIPAFIALICYEAIFSGDLGADPAAAQFILNITNDSWFDGSIGPAQHAHHARLRAVESGLPMVRVANTGLTMLVDPLGRVTAELAPLQPALMDVVPALPIGGTLFNRLGHLPFFAALALGLLIALWSARRHRHREA